MSKEIEADGYITRATDLKQTERKVCANCKHLRHDNVLRRYRCSVGHIVDSADWRMKYEVCDEWEKTEWQNNAACVARISSHAEKRK